MSLLHKALASLGIGAATVDTKLEKADYTGGEVIHGEVQIRGGNVDQQIDAIYLTVYTNYKREFNDTEIMAKGVIEKVQVTEPLTIKANENKVIPFSFTLPIDTPVTIGKTQVWINTHLDIDNAIDPKDKDYINVHPSLLVADILEELSNLGFRLREVECEQASLRLQNRYPFVQEFEFVPTSGSFRSHLDELEIIFLSQTPDYVEGIMQIDRKVRGLGSLLSEALEMDESFVRFTIRKSDVPTLRGTLQKLITKYV
ncbi:sporulation protein [uncultured Rummeliibacillus sp.]|uniref:sporulation protein n=1 Tax=uncultured Rummeliibacillus sp. TaxID=762292 RepID=UPI0026134B14|nr:sporulation protein [uncultured Rummeliibacillus sp.]